MNGAKFLRRNIAAREAFSSQGDNLPREVSAMTKTLTALATAAALSVAVVAVPQESQAAWRGGHIGGGHWGGGGHWRGGHWGGGAVLGGLAAGAIIGGALSAPYYGGYGPYYGGDYAYGGYGHCWRERIGTPYGWQWRRVCD
jgi:hypothetical protein